jgi:hypothetical protein
MKKLSILLIISCIGLIQGCIVDDATYEKHIKEQEQARKNSRIHVIEDSYPYYIIMVDSVEYISRYQGGIYPLIKNK